MPMLSALCSMPYAFFSISPPLRMSNGCQGVKTTLEGIAWMPHFNNLGIDTMPPPPLNPKGNPPFMTLLYSLCPMLSVTSTDDILPIYNS